MPSVPTCSSLIYSQYFYAARGGILLAPGSGAAPATSSYAPASRRSPAGTGGPPRPAPPPSSPWEQCEKTGLLIYLLVYLIHKPSF